jgi:hypothetical protein
MDFAVVLRSHITAMRGAMNKLFREILAFLLGLVSAIVSVLICTAVVELMFLVPAYESGRMLSVLVALVALLFGFALGWRFARRRLKLPPFIVPSKSGIILLVFFGITWAFGAPMVQSELTSASIARYKMLKAENDEVWNSHPYIKCFVAVPVALGVILTYHEYQIAPLYGAGTWNIHVWYGLGTYQLFGVGAWIS